MIELTYPGLYDVADAASTRQQKLYLLVIRAEFAVLFAASILTINIVNSATYIILYGITLAFAAGLLAVRSICKLEQGWYQARALAESIKTATWKYVMRAKPFDHGSPDIAAREIFRDFLSEILTANQRIGGQFDGDNAAKEQITAAMVLIRDLPRDHRLAVYMERRVENQSTWYAAKSKNNRAWALRSVIVLAGLYALAFAALLVRVAHPSWSYSHPEPIILLASAVIGWMQIKKYNELATSYNLTAIEIGILKSRAPEIKSDSELSDFIDDAEEAFSREHTQWLARRSH